MKAIAQTWQFWAILSACFAALTAIFAKLGVQDLNPDYATFLRTIVILLVLAVIVQGTGQWQSLDRISGSSAVFLVLSALATGASWVCYFRALKIGDAARVAPVDKFSVVLVALLGAMLLGERLSVPNWIGVILVFGGLVLVAYR